MKQKKQPAPCEWCGEATLEFCVCCADPICPKCAYKAKCCGSCWRGDHLDGCRPELITQLQKINED